MNRPASPRTTPIRSRIMRAGFALAPILYMLGLIGVTSGVLFSGYSQIMRTNIAISDSVNIKSDLGAAANTLASSSQLMGGTTICPPVGGSASTTGGALGTGCTGLFASQPVPKPLNNISNLTPASDTKAPTYYNGTAAVTLTQAGILGTGKEVGIFKSGYGIKQLDPWGHYYIYCRWEKSISTGTDPSIMIISAGPDGSLQTSCNDAGAACNLKASCDDSVYFLNVSNVQKQASLWYLNTNAAGTAQVSYGQSPVNVDNNGNITAPGYIAVTGTSGLTGAVTAGSTLGVTGAITGSSTLAITGTSSLTGAVTAGSNLAVTGTSLLSGFVTTGTSASVGGKLGVNVTTPQNTLDVSGNAVIGSYAGSAVTNSNGLVVSGSTGLGTSSPSQTLDVNGVAKVSTGIITGLIYPPSDSTTAVKFGTSAGSATVVMDIDTTNKRVGVGTTPAGYTFEVGGTSKIYNDSIIAGSETIGQTSLGTTKLYVAGDILTTGRFYGSGSGLTSLTVPTSSINATGTANSTTFLRGDGQWISPSSSQVNLAGGTSQFTQNNVLPIDFGGTGYGTATGATKTASNLLDNLFSNDSAPTQTIPSTRLATQSLTPGAYTSANITVSAQGIVTAVSNGSGGSGGGTSPTLPSIPATTNQSRSSTAYSSVVIPVSSSFTSAVPVSCLNLTTAATSPCTNVGILQPSGVVQWSGGPFATLAPGDSFQLAMMTPSTTVTSSTITVYVGGSSTTWTVTTAANTPASFQSGFVWSTSNTNVASGANTSTLTGYPDSGTTYYTASTALSGFTPSLAANCVVTSTYGGTLPTCTIYVSGVPSGSSTNITSTAQTVAVYVPVPNADSTSTTATLTIGVTSGAVTLLTGNSPKAFSFATTSPVSLGASTTTSVVISGIATTGSGETAICTGCTLSLTANGTYASSVTGVLGGSTLYVKETVPSTYSTSSLLQSTTGTIAINSTSATWTATALETPDAFSMTWATTASPPEVSGGGGNTLVGYAGGGTNAYVMNSISPVNYTASASAPLPVTCSATNSMTCKVSTTGSTGTFVSSPASLTATGGSVSVEVIPTNLSDSQPSTVSLTIGATTATAVFSTSSAPPALSLSTSSVSNLSLGASGSTTIAISNTTLATGGSGEPASCTIASQAGGTGATCQVSISPSTTPLSSVSINGGKTLIVYLTPPNAYFASATATISVGTYTTASFSAYNLSPTVGQILKVDGTNYGAYIGSYTAGASTVNLFVQPCDGGATYTPSPSGCSSQPVGAKFSTTDTYISASPNPYIQLGTTDGKNLTQAWLYYISSQTTSLSTYASFPSTTNGTSTIVAHAGSADGTPTVLNTCTSLGAGWHLASSGELVAAHTALAGNAGTYVPLTNSYGYWVSDFGTFNNNFYQPSFNIGSNGTWTTLYNSFTYAQPFAGNNGSYRCAYY